MRKRLLIMLTMAAMVAMLITGCGGKAGNDNDEAVGEASSEPTLPEKAEKPKLSGKIGCLVNDEGFPLPAILEEGGAEVMVYQAEYKDENRTSLDLEKQQAAVEEMLDNDVKLIFTNVGVLSTYTWPIYKSALEQDVPVVGFGPDYWSLIGIFTKEIFDAKPFSYYIYQIDTTYTQGMYVVNALGVDNGDGKSVNVEFYGKNPVITTKKGTVNSLSGQFILRTGDDPVNNVKEVLESCYYDGALLDAFVIGKAGDKLDELLEVITTTYKGSNEVIITCEASTNDIVKYIEEGKITMGVTADGYYEDIAYGLASAILDGKEFNESYIDEFNLPVASVGNDTENGSIHIAPKAKEITKDNLKDFK